MRLWHYKLIPVLPQKMLVSQWRELIAIKRQWEKGTLIHPLVSYVKDYDKKYFIDYIYRIRNELESRDVKWNYQLLLELHTFCLEDIDGTYEINTFNFSEHDDEYLKICYYNLKEKYLRGIITKEEWDKIEDLVKEDICIAKEIWQIK